MGEDSTYPENCQQQQQQQQSHSQDNVAKYDIEQMKIFAPVGRGAKGVVFRIRIEDSDEDYAFKVVLKSTMRKSGNAKQSIGFEQSRVFFEQQVLREFDYPLLPRLRGVFETENVFGYAMDYCSGGNLSLLRKLQVEKMFSDDIIRFYGAEMVLALEYLHKKGIVYRDLKPDNVLIQDTGHLMLVDFDLSTKLVPNSIPTRPTFESAKKPELPKLQRKKSQLPKFYAFCKAGIPAEESVDSEVESVNSVETAESDSVGKSNSFVGTEEYVAPEIIKGNGHDFAVDLWSLGIVLYEMLYGTTPFRGANRKEIFYRILSKAPELIGGTTPLRDLISKLLIKDPKLRITLEEIKGHDFFKGVDWERILQLSRPPFIPDQRSENEDGVDGIPALESIVYGIFKKEVVLNKSNIDSNTSTENTSYIKSSLNNNVEKDSITRKGVWLEGLDQSPISTDFFVF